MQRDVQAVVGGMVDQIEGAEDLIEEKEGPLEVRLDDDSDYLMIIEDWLV